MSISSPLILAVLVGAATFAQARRGAALDDAEKVPGRDNAVLKKILSSDVEIIGEWGGSRLPRYERNVLWITPEPNKEGSYSLEFYFWMDKGGGKTERRTGTLAGGILTLDKPVKEIGLARDSYDVLYAVRVDGKTFLLPSPHAGDLKSADELRPRIAYQIRKQPEKPRARPRQ